LTIKIGGYDFEGPFLSTDRLEERPGVYAVICPEEGWFAILDVGEAADVKARLESDEAEECWREKSSGAYMFSVYYTGELGQERRQDIEMSLRKQYRPPCGGRPSHAARKPRT